MIAHSQEQDQSLEEEWLDMYYGLLFEPKIDWRKRVPDLIGRRAMKRPLKSPNYFEICEDLHVNSSSTVLLLPSYDRNAYINFFSTLPCFFPIFFILIIMHRYKFSERYKFTVYFITIGYLISAIPTFLEHGWYLMHYWSGQMEVNFVVCSIFNRVGGIFATFSNSLLVIVAIDRFWGVYLETALSKRVLFILSVVFISPVLYPLYVTFTRRCVQQMDMCGPTWGTGIPALGELLFVTQWIFSMVALCLNIFILIYYYRRKRANKIIGVTRMSSRTARDEWRLCLSLTVQSLIPILTTMPVFIAMVLVYERVPMPRLYFDVANSLGYLSKTFVPLTYVLFVPQFREAAARMLGLYCEPGDPSTASTYALESSRKQTVVVLTEKPRCVKQTGF